jgi:hypothetical protein
MESRGRKLMVVTLLAGVAAFVLLERVVGS